MVHANDDNFAASQGVLCIITSQSQWPMQVGDVVCAMTKASKILEALENQLGIDQWMPCDAEAHAVG